jgi:hypothetical protein
VTFNTKHLQVAILVAAPHKDRLDVIHFDTWRDKTIVLAHLAKWLALHDS